MGYADSMNLYNYVVNNPINYTDPTGNFIPIWPIIRIGCGIGSGVVSAVYCHACYQCIDGAWKTMDMASKGLDPEKFECWKRAAQPGSECIGLCTKCGAAGVSALYGLWKPIYTGGF